ncbi:MAG TPA: hypothetical protein VFC10_07710 [Terriglobia bacterium]|jgi:hypothetical protein|nr:hypothetical protein [Terriglobia bacterium]
MNSSTIKPRELISHEAVQVAPPPEPGACSKRVFAATLGIAALLLLALELRWPYYFLQDDGLEEFLPSYFHNWRSLLSGHLPLYDFHIFGGIPHLAMGQTGVFYVPEYVAMFLSQVIWGHPFATIDLMAFMHGLIAVAGGYVLLRYMGATDAAAAFGALTALSGFFIWVGRMWPVALMLCAWFPWMVWASLRYLDKPSVGRAGWLMFFRLGLLYGGQLQFFVLAMIFEHLFALSYSLVKRRECWGLQYLGYVALDVPTALLGLPLLLPMWAEVGRSLERAGALSYAEFSDLSISPLWWVFGQLFVFGQIRLPRDYIQASIPYLSYIGYIASLLPFGAGVLWKKRPQTRPWVIASAICFLMAFLWCSNMLGPLIFHLPILNRFRWPFKVVFFAGFFQCLVAALVLMLFNVRWQRIVTIGSIVNWIVIFCVLPNHAWRVREYHPPLKSPWQTILADGRYVVITPPPLYFVSREFVGFNYSELWGLDNLLGYDQLVPRSNATLLLGRPLTRLEISTATFNGRVDNWLLDHLKKWSDRYVLVGPTRSYDSPMLKSAGLQVQAVKDGWTLWKDPNALPRVRWGDVPAGTGADAGIRWAEHVNSIDVDLSEWPGLQLVFAFVSNHGLETCIENRCAPVAQSADGLIRVNVPPRTQHVRLVYHCALLLPSVLIALATLTVYLLILFRGRKSGANQDLGPEHLPIATPAQEEN